jgi:hypothetical protein
MLLLSVVDAVLAAGSTGGSLVAAEAESSRAGSVKDAGDDALAAAKVPNAFRPWAAGSEAAGALGAGFAPASGVVFAGTGIGERQPSAIAHSQTYQRNRLAVRKAAASVAPLTRIDRPETG